METAVALVMNQEEEDDEVWYRTTEELDTGKVALEVVFDVVERIQFEALERNTGRTGGSAGNGTGREQETVAGCSSWKVSGAICTPPRPQPAEVT
mmetsp:Transcript_7954/g.20049  ORF Transcript_7954/g.20049 Transcript_7954/m.20049 type:complete len:95 (+) Transcript_7954:1994-2278(+)